MSIVAKDLYSLVRLRINASRLKRFNISGIYPLGSENESSIQEAIAYLAKRNIFSIGRLAEWKYVDLHELELEDKIYEYIHRSK